MSRAARPTRGRAGRESATATSQTGKARDVSRGAARARDESARGGDKASASAAAAGDVSLADADAELNFAETADPDEAASARPDSAGPTARPLSGGGNDDGDSPVSKMAARRDAKASALSLGGGGDDELVADPGADVAAAAAAAERSAERAAEEAEAAAGADVVATAAMSPSVCERAPEPSSSGRGGDPRGTATASSPRRRRRKLEAFDALLASAGGPPERLAGEAHRSEPAHRGDAGAALRRVRAAVRGAHGFRDARLESTRSGNLPRASTAAWRTRRPSTRR